MIINAIYCTKYNQLTISLNGMLIVGVSLRACSQENIETDPLRLILRAFQGHSQACIIRAGKNKG